MNLVLRLQQNILLLCVKVIFPFASPTSHNGLITRRSWLHIIQQLRLTLTAVQINLSWPQHSQLLLLLHSWQPVGHCDRPVTQTSQVQLLVTSPEPNNKLKLRREIQEKKQK